MLRDASSAVDRAFPFRLRLVIHLEPACISAGPCVEQCRRGLHKSIRSRPIEPEVPREAQVRQRIPTPRTAFRGGVRAIVCNESPDSGRVAQDGARVNAGGCDVRSSLQHGFGLLERSGRMPAVERNTCIVDKIRRGIIVVGHSAG
jgi:NAD-dependent dihydropyrimidine dehydrogenase PreA subunit